MLKIEWMWFYSFDPARVKINSLSSIMLHSTEFWLVPNEERIERKNKKLLFNDESIGVHYIDEDETNENFRRKGMDHRTGLHNSIIQWKISTLCFFKVKTYLRGWWPGRWILTVMKYSTEISVVENLKGLILGTDTSKSYLARVNLTFE